MSRNAWEKLMRLRTMGTPEIACRLRTTLQSEVDRLRFFLHVPGQPDKKLLERGGRRSFCSKRYLKEGPARRFYLSANKDGRARLRNLIEVRFPEWKTRAIEEAERLCQHRVELLGYGEFQLGPEIDWHRDPVTGQRWQLRFWADYDLVHDAGAGDPKTIHELNRHQHLPRLAKAYFLTGEERYAQEAISQITTWIEQNPPGTGIHWHSSLEISLRVLSWLWTIFFLLPAKSFDEAAAQRVTTSLCEQLDHIYRYPSVFSSPNTHLLGEAAALYLAGVLFAEWEPAARWRETGQMLLVQEAERQVSSEGIHSELSSYYHCYTLDFYLQVLALAMYNELPWPELVWQQLERMMEFLMHLTRPDGSIPLLGDDDGGRALALNETHYRSFRDALCAGAVLCGRPDFKYVAGEFQEETLWLLGEKAWHVYRFMQTRKPRAMRASYPANGYFIQRSDWNEQASHLVFDCGQMGMNRGGHGHADALSVTLFSGGKQLLVDPGTGIYNSAPEWRNFFRSSKAHNTAVVDGLEQSESGGTFNWKEIAQTRLRRQVALCGVEYIEGEHSGYCRLPQKIVHRRGVLYCQPHCWVIVDRFLGEGTHRFDLLYHFPPEAETSLYQSKGDSAETDLAVRAGSAGLRLFLCGSTPPQAEIISGRNESIQGWVSHRYGSKEPSPTLQVSLESSAPAVVVSLLLPFHADTQSELARQGSGSYKPQQIETPDGSAIAIALECGDNRDLWVVPTGTDGTKLLGYEMHGEFFWVHSDASGQRQLFALNVSHFSHQGRALIEDGVPTDYRFICWAEDGKIVEHHQEEEKTLCAEFAAL